MQTAALRAIGSPLRYEAMDVAPDALPAALAEIAAGDVAGNVTIPHKARVAAACARLSAPAERAAAVNVFWVEEGALAGDNTDIPAFSHLATLTLGTPAADLRIAVLGAGGAASAVLAAIEHWPGCRVSVFNRTRERAEALAARFPVVTAVAGSPEEAVTEAALIVNASALGLQPRDPLPVDIAWLPRDAAVVDLVYDPAGRGTRWVREAAAAGHRARDGMEMLLEQGALAFERWLGVPAPRTVMREALVRHQTATPAP